MSQNAYLGVAGGAGDRPPAVSGVTIGIGFLLSQEGFVDTAHVVPIIMGANLGATVTDLLASIGLDVEAHRVAVAWAYLIFNLFAATLGESSSPDDRNLAKPDRSRLTGQSETRIFDPRRGQARPRSRSYSSIAIL